jgi:hypothetical protein
LAVSDCKQANFVLLYLYQVNTAKTIPLEPLFQRDRYIFTSARPPSCSPEANATSNTLSIKVFGMLEFPAPGFPEHAFRGDV